MTLPVPGLYVGSLRHRRHRPREHAFTYPLFLALLDIDRIPEMMKASRLTGYNRWNWASFDERDHFGDPSRPLRQRLADDAAASGVSLPDGPIFLLTNLRYLGYCFNPVSFFYCYDGAGDLRVILAEVNNTFGETHNYWLTPAQAETPTRQAAPAAAGLRARVHRYRTPKVFHVSPFMPLDMGYEWVLSAPGDRLVARIDTLQDGARVLDATLGLRYRPWSAAEIRRVLFRYPWMTAKVITAIHYQALRLYLKRLRFYPHPGTPPSVGRPRAWKKGSAACPPLPSACRSES
jgi:uncharacterized protein